LTLQPVSGHQEAWAQLGRLNLGTEANLWSCKGKANLTKILAQILSQTSSAQTPSSSPTWPIHFDPKIVDLRPTQRAELNAALKKERGESIAPNLQANQS